MPAELHRPDEVVSEVLARMRVLRARKRSVLLQETGKGVGIAVSKGKYLVTSSDPITGTSSRMGWYAINVSANDVATSGIMPRMANIFGLFPENTGEEDIEHMITEISAAASDLRIAVVGKHMEVDAGLKMPVIVVTSFGFGNEFVTPAGAKPYDSILMTKTAAIEGTSILAQVRSVRNMIGFKMSRRGQDLMKRLSILKEARTAFRSGKIHAMHDATEGGIAGAVYEMSLASGLGFELHADSVPINDTTSAICSKLSLNPLRLIGSGSLLISSPPNSTDSLRKQLQNQRIKCSVIGRFLPSQSGRWLLRSGKLERLREGFVEDELWSALAKYATL